MEQERYYSSRAGRVLENSDLIRMERTLFRPATARCDVMGLDNPLHFKHDEPRRREDGLEYRHSFYSIRNVSTGLMQYRISELAAEYTTLKTLTPDQRNMVRLRYQEKYIEDGGRMDALGRDEIWQALYNQEVYQDTQLSIVSTQKFAFMGGDATKSFSIERCLTVGGMRVVIDEYQQVPMSDGGNKGLQDSSLVDERILFNEMNNDMTAVTTKDMEVVVGILEDMQLVSHDDQDRFVRGI